MTEIPVLETERLILRPLQTEDAAQIQKIFPQWDIVKYMSASTPWPYPEGRAKIYVEGSIKKINKNKRWHWTIRLKENPDEMIGNIVLVLEEGQKDNRGFWLVPEHWGKGYMTEASLKVTHYAFDVLGWDRLYLTNAKNNIGSFKMKEKQGAVLIEEREKEFVNGTEIQQIWLLTKDAFKSSF